MKLITAQSFGSMVSPCIKTERLSVSSQIVKTAQSFGSMVSPCIKVKNVTIFYDCLYESCDYHFLPDLFEDGCSNIWIFNHEREKAIRVRNMDEVRKSVYLVKARYDTLNERKRNYDVLNFLTGLPSSPDNENKQMFIYFFDEDPAEPHRIPSLNTHIFEEIKHLQTKKNYDVVFICFGIVDPQNFCDPFKRWLQRQRYVQVSIGLNLGKVILDLIRNPDYDRFAELDDIRHDCRNSTPNVYITYKNVLDYADKVIGITHYYLLEHLQARYTDINFFCLYGVELLSMSHLVPDKYVILDWLPDIYDDLSGYVINRAQVNERFT